MKMKKRTSATRIARRIAAANKRRANRVRFRGLKIQRRVECI